ncbi:cysteine desulfurase family protein [Parachlamydia acanthamoebae]|uniref:Cysteine desulfurase n=2 Tax=Parachlamydia acanthamoebae TaxID=83552 RepID=F8L0U5_PARAV|nr:cysteine desulfurase family protein [Parachlamydia acanthamoebae]KIA77433.1 Cysteine desulfurase [Parachlamydia acanthamoebae]CCB86848.1 cysteine desulfurase [Parachlamydia acanthamoebae UV-7]
MNQKIYLDNNASTPLAPQVLQTMLECLSENVGNPSSIHSFGQASRAKLVNARHSLASYLKVPPDEIIFTSGGTEGINLLIKGLLEQKNGHVITSNVEHACIFNTLKAYEKKGQAVSWLNAGLRGAVQPEAIKAAIRPDTRLIVLTAVNGETGVKLDVASIASIAQEAKIPFVLDSVAQLGKEEISILPGVSAMCFSAHKIHGPKGVGFIWLKRGTPFISTLTGGPQEFGKRAGSENLAGIVGLASAVMLLNQELPEAAHRMRSLRDHFEATLLGNLPGVKINGQGERIANVSNLSFEGIEGETLITLLDREGIAVSHGSACSSGALEPSRILLNMGVSMDQSTSSIRFSLSRFTTAEEIDKTIATVIRLVSHLRNLMKP